MVVLRSMIVVFGISIITVVGVKLDIAYGNRAYGIDELEGKLYAQSTVNHSQQNEINKLYQLVEELKMENQAQALLISELQQ